MMLRLDGREYRFPILPLQDRAAAGFSESSTRDAGASSGDP